MARHRSARAALPLLLLLSTVPVPWVLAPPLYGAPQANRRQNPRQAEQLDLALGLLQRGMHDDAARRLQRFLRQNPNHTRAAEAHYRLGTCYLKLNKTAAAVDSFEVALGQRGRFPLRAECRYRLGHALKGQKQLRKAAQQFRRLVEQEGDKHYLASASLYAEGECLRDSNNSEAALKSFKAAAACAHRGKNDGQFGLPALYQAGFVLMRAERYPEASATFAEAAERYPKNKARAECLYLAGESAYRGGDPKNAALAYQAAVAAGGSFADESRLGLARCAKARGQTDKALTHYAELVRRHPKEPAALTAQLEAGRLLLSKKRYQEVVTELRGTLQRSDLSKDDRRNVHELLGLAELELRRPEAAAEQLQKALALATRNADRARLAYNLGEAYADNKQWDNAARQYGVAAAHCKGDDKQKELLGDALYGQCLALHRKKRYADSNKAAEQLVEQVPDHRLAAAARFAWAENQFERKKYQEAQPAYESVPKDHELRRKARFKAAWCSYLQQDYEGAAGRFGDLAQDREQQEHKDGIAEEALSMAALSHYQAKDLDNALKTADRYRARYPKGGYLARTERVAARVLKQRNKLDAAADRLAVAARAEKSGARSGLDTLEIADVLYKRGDFNGAKDAYAKIVGRRDPAGARAHEGLAWCSFELGNNDDCRSWIDKGLKHPKIGEGRANLLELRSALAHRQKDWATAEQAAQDFLSRHQNHPRAPSMTYSLGVAQSRAGKLKESRGTLEALAQRGGHDRMDRVHYELGWVYQKLKLKDEAQEQFRQVAAKSKDKDLRGEAHLHLGEAQLQSNSDEALGHLGKVEGRYRGRARYRIGFYWFEKEQHEKALPAFLEIVKLGPDQKLYLEAVFLSGECHYRLGQHGEAAGQFRTLLQKAPDHARAQLARLHLGASALANKQPKQAAAVLEEYLRREQKQEQKDDGDKSSLARANLWLGRARQASQDHERAETAFLNTTRLTDSELAAEAQFRLGQSRQARNDLEGAADAFVKLPILYGHDRWVQRGLFGAGDCYQRLKQPKKAKKFYQELVDRYPKSELATTAKQRLKEIRRKL